MSPHFRRGTLVIFLILGCCSLYFGGQLSFTFSLDQFFPDGDEDLAFYQGEAERLFSETDKAILAAFPGHTIRALQEA